MRYLAAAAALIVLGVGASHCAEELYVEPSPFAPKPDPRVELIGWDDQPERDLFDNGDNEVQFTIAGVFTGIPPDSHSIMKLDLSGWECTIYRYDPDYDMIALCGDPGNLSFGNTTLVSGLIGAYARQHDTAALKALSEFFAEHPIEGRDTSP